MIAGEARVGGVPGEQVDRAGVSDERAGAIVELGDDLDGEKSESGAQPGGDRCAAHGREALMAGEEEQDHE